MHLVMLQEKKNDYLPPYSPVCAQAKNALVLADEEDILPTPSPFSLNASYLFYPGIQNLPLTFRIAVITLLILSKCLVYFQDCDCSRNTRVQLESGFTPSSSVHTYGAAWALLNPVFKMFLQLLYLILSSMILS